MIAKITQGASFKGAYLYYSHDKRVRGHKTQSAERLAWSHTENLCGLEADTSALNVMIETAKKNTHCKNPVYAFSLNWAPTENPSQEHMLETARGALKALGMEDHQAMMFAHNDTAHKHVHVMANRVSQEIEADGQTKYKAVNIFGDRHKLSRWALEYERAHGLHCEKRAAIAKAKEENQDRRYNPDISPFIAGAWGATQDGQSFRAALEAQGWAVGLGDKKDRFLVVGPDGQSHDLLREINKTQAKGSKLRAADIDSRLADIDRATLKRVAELQAERQAQQAAPEMARPEKKAEAAPARPEEKTARRMPAYYDRKAEQAARLDKIDEAKARAAVRANNAEIRSQKQTPSLEETHDRLQKLRQEHQTLRAKHEKETGQLLREIEARRRRAAEEVEKTYPIAQLEERLSKAQDRLASGGKGSFFGKITGRDQRRQEQALQEIESITCTLANTRERAAEFQKTTEHRIRLEAEALANRQKAERQALSPLPEIGKERAREVSSEQQQGHERGLAVS